MTINLKRNFIFTIFLCLLTGFSVSAKEVKFVQITDSHYSQTAQEYVKRDVEHSQTYLEKAIFDINTIPDLDFVAFTGDNIDTANSKDLVSFLKIANKLKVPYYVVIGNHEVFQSQHFDKVEYMKTVSKYSKNCRTRKANYVFRKNGFVFIVVDGAKEVIPGPAGYFKKDTLKWLDKQLRINKNKDVVIFQHFPIVPPYYNRTHATYNVAEYEAVLKKYTNVVSIISGHYHGNGEKMVDGVYHISTPALVEPPHNFKVIEIEAKGAEKPQVYTQLRHAE